MTIDQVPIYAVLDAADGELIGFSFDAQPGTCEPDRTHTPIDRGDPGGQILLVAFNTPEEAEAYMLGFDHGNINDQTGWIARTFADDLTCVLVEWPTSPVSWLDILDTRTRTRA